MESWKHIIHTINTKAKRKRRKDKQQMEHIEKSRRMIDFNPTRVMITLNVNGLKIAMKHRIVRLYQKT